MRRSERAAVVGIGISVLVVVVLLGVVSWLFANELDTSNRITTLEQRSACAKHETAKCRQSIEGFIDSMSPDERRALAQAVAPYLVVVGRTVVVRKVASPVLIPRFPSSHSGGGGPGNGVGHHGR